jgi:hypothetical protein
MIARSCRCFVVCGGLFFILGSVSVAVAAAVARAAAAVVEV